MGEANTSYIVSITDFTPAGETTGQDDYKVTLKTNANGNIFLYGSWTDKTEITVGDNKTLKLTDASIENTAYVADISKMTAMTQARQQIM